MKNKPSFFERLTGGMSMEDDKEIEEKPSMGPKDNGWMEEESGEGELAVDMHQTPDEIVMKAMIAGVKPDDLDVNITRDMVTIEGKRNEEREIDEGDYFYKELYWGSFSRSILLPEEIEPEEAQATEKHGLLTIHLPKVDRKKTSKLKVKSS